MAVIYGVPKVLVKMMRVQMHNNNKTFPTHKADNWAHAMRTMEAEYQARKAEAICKAYGSAK